MGLSRALGGGRGGMSQTRRLAAILAADVAGYSRLMGADEEGTLERLKALRRELLDPKIAKHRGRIVKTTGDGLLVEFASVVDAVRCAVAVQQAIPDRNTGVAADSRIELRIGINLGDVMSRATTSICAPMRWSCRRQGKPLKRSVLSSRRSRAFRVTDQPSPGPHSAVFDCFRTSGAKIARRTAGRASISPGEPSK
jgi:adenylate/guanylate cyclase family protein